MNHERKGFTLIEILLVITIMAVVSSLGIASYTRGAETQKLIVAQAQVVAKLQEVKSRAQSQVKPSNCTSGQLNIWYVTLYLPNVIDLDVNCTANVAGEERTFLPSGVTIYSVSDQRSSPATEYVGAVGFFLYDVAGGVHYNLYGTAWQLIGPSNDTQPRITVTNSSSRITLQNSLGAKKYIDVYADGRIIPQ